MVLFLAIGNEVYRQAGLVSDSSLPWRFQSELGFVMVVLLVWGESGRCISSPLVKLSYEEAQAMPTGSCGSIYWLH